MKRNSLLVIMALFFLAACGSDGGTANQICNPGNTQECTCDDGVSMGIQTCVDGGAAWSSCTGCVAPQDVIEDTTPEEDIVEDTNKPEETVEETVEDVEEDLPFVCLLNNCTQDAHCTGCSDGRHICLIEESRCVACNPNTNEGCDEGEECSGWGICVPATLTCPTDGEGNPTVECTSNLDCKACSPMHQVCDTETHHCQACTQNNTTHCLKSDVCIEGVCSPRCPASCETDNDCLFCGPPDNPLHACNSHKCAECSATWPCPADEVCKNGSCYPQCGLPGPTPGTCTVDEDCKWCGDPKTPGTYVCRKPINDPDHGTCQPPVEGCEDLGDGIAVLPEPYSQYTQLCSTDENCENIDIELNVGELIRDLAGVEEVYGVAIGDATVAYGMHQCAEVNVTESISCGICVPCEKDSDCMSINVDPLIPGLFPDDALVQIAGAILIDMLWGEVETHDLNFYCQPVALGYGACLPCANPLQPCGKTDDGGGSGECNHNVCEEGDALDPSCGPCAEEICANDSYCCEVEWDAMCVFHVDTYCATNCEGEGGCAPDICDNPDLPAQSSTCSDCVAAVCESDPFCCNTESGLWDDYCVAGAVAEPLCADICGGSCAHDECEVGAPLDADCSECATAICEFDSWCCEYEWDSVCVEYTADEEACSCPVI